MLVCLGARLSESGQSDLQGLELQQAKRHLRSQDSGGLRSAAMRCPSLSRLQGFLSGL